MLGATHACANPLTTHYSTVHGAALRCSFLQSCAGMPQLLGTICPASEAIERACEFQRSGFF